MDGRGFITKKKNKKNGGSKKQILKHTTNQKTRQIKTHTQHPLKRGKGENRETMTISVPFVPSGEATEAEGVEGAAPTGACVNDLRRSWSPPAEIADWRRSPAVGEGAAAVAAWLFFSSLYRSGKEDLKESSQHHRRVFVPTKRLEFSFNSAETNKIKRDPTSEWGRAIAG